MIEPHPLPSRWGFYFALSTNPDQIVVTVVTTEIHLPFNCHSLKLTEMSERTKRDIWEGAVPASEYYATPAKKVSLESVTKSKSGRSAKVPIKDRQDLRESVVQRDIIRYLKWRGAWVHKAKAANLVGSFNAGTARLASTDVGVPDLLVCYDGHFLAFEVKAPTASARVSGEQVAQINHIIKAGGVAHLVSGPGRGHFRCLR
jgi:hypothetical protein